MVVPGCCAGGGALAGGPARCAAGAPPSHRRCQRRGGSSKRSSTCPRRATARRRPPNTFALTSHSALRWPPDGGRGGMVYRDTSLGVCGKEGLLVGWGVWRGTRAWGSEVACGGWELRRRPLAGCCRGVVDCVPHAPLHRSCQLSGVLRRSALHLRSPLHASEGHLCGWHKLRPHPCSYRVVSASSSALIKINW